MKTTSDGRWASDNYYYTLDGMRHEHPVKGINIHRGKKIM